MATMTSERIARWRCGSAVSQKRVTTFIVAPLSVALASYLAHRLMRQS